MTENQTVARTGRRATLADVARFAGVSVSTASKALNDRTDVRPATRERVRVAAEQLGFEPNSLARALFGDRSGTVGMLTSDLVGRFSLPILMGVEDALGAGEVSVFLCDARGDAIREQFHVRALLRRQIDGLIVVGSATDPRPPLTPDVPVPVVYVYAPSERPHDTSVVADNFGAGRSAVAHMLHMGRRRIAHIGGDETFTAATDRAAGILAELADAGLGLAGERVHYGTWSESWGRTAARLLRGQGPSIDAIICGNDQIARGVLDVLNQSRVDVPGEVAVMGFDNWDVLAADSSPPLTSIDMNLENLGRRAALLLREAIDGRPRPGVETLPCRLVARASTAPSSGDPSRSR